MRTINWGMIGCGAVTNIKSGPGLYKANNSALLAVTDANIALAQGFAERHGIAKVYNTNEELVADKDIDIVYIATPPSTHKALSELVAKAGKHVCVEKPMAMHHHECQEIIDICEKHNVKLYIAFYRRAMERFVKIKELIDSGEIGEVRTVRAIQHMPAAADEYDKNKLPWRLLPEVSGGGKFLDMGVHTLDFFEYLFGKVEEVYGIANNQAKMYDVEDTVVASWRHKDGTIGSGSWCYVCEYQREYVEIVGSKGHIEFVFFNDSPIIVINENGKKEIEIKNPEHVHQPFFQSIVDELNGVSTCPGSIESAVNASWVADEILKNFRK